MMALGAKGVISVLSNVAPRQVHDMCAAFKAGDVAKARQMQIDAIPLIEALFCEVNDEHDGRGSGSVPQTVSGYGTGKPRSSEK